MKDFFNNLINLLKTNILVVAVFIAATFSIYTYMSVIKYGKSSSMDFSDKRNYISIKDTVINKVATAYLYDSVNKIAILINPIKYKDTYTFNRIVSQLTMVKNRIAAHDKVIDYFIINLYYFIIIQSIFMVLVCVLGLIISKKGWGDSGNNLLGAFLICAGFLLFFQVLPKGMKFEDNLASNKAHFLAYSDMENRILTFLSNTEKNVEFTCEIDDMLKSYHTISFDLQQVPFSEVQKQFQEIKNSAKDNKDEPAKPIYIPVQAPVIHPEMLKAVKDS